MIGPDIPDDATAYGNFRYPNRWPPENLMPSSKFKEPLLKYRALLCNLSNTLMEVLAKGLPYGNPRIFDPFCKDPLAVVRLLHYPPQANLDDPKQVGAGAHTDFGAITLLLQDDKGGLQVLNEHTKKWIEVKPNRDAYVVNVGDMLQMWTKGEYKSNIHRVINSSGTHRYSVPFFFDGNLDYVLKPLDGSAETGITVEDFMKERFKRTYN
jgi:isopenicillin N synthase-like dioxygenase